MSRQWTTHGALLYSSHPRWCLSTWQFGDEHWLYDDDDDMKKKNMNYSNARSPTHKNRLLELEDCSDGALMNPEIGLELRQCNHPGPYSSLPNRFSSNDLYIWDSPVMYASHYIYSDCALPHRKSSWSRDIVCRPPGWLQTNANEVRSNASVCETANLVATTTYKCHVRRTDSMARCPDNGLMVYSYRLDPKANNANCHLQQKWGRKRKTR